MPGVTVAEACKRFAVSKAAVLRARRDLVPASALSLAELALAALSRNGARQSGTLGNLSGIAGWIDYLNHDACSAEDVRTLLDTLVESGVLSIRGKRWKLRQAWP